MLKVIYEDNHVIVVEKTPNQPVMPDESGDLDLLTQVKQYIKEKYKKPGDVYLGLVHRLDRPVGGLMVFARTSKAASRLSESIRQNRMERKYLAVVKGIPDGMDFELNNWLGKDEKKKMAYIAKPGSKDAKQAKLKFKNIRIMHNMALLDITLETGRYHQIRVQLAHAGYPIYGDMKYSDGPKGHIALYAYYLSFLHPVKKEYMTFESKPDYSIPPWPLFR